MTRSSNTWLLDLPLVLLGIRSSLKVDQKCSAAELVYGNTLRLPGDFFLSSTAVPTTVPDPLSYVERLRSTMSRLTATPPRHPSKSPPRVPTNLSACTHVFIRQDAIRRSLQQPYNGPFPITQRQPKYFIVQVNGKPQSISIDRLKPAFLLDDTPPPVPEPLPVLTTTTTRTTRSGRQVRWPDCLTF